MTVCCDCVLARCGTWAPHAPLVRDSIRVGHPLFLVFFLCFFLGVLIAHTQPSPHTAEPTPSQARTRIAVCALPRPPPGHPGDVEAGWPRQGVSGAARPARALSVQAYPRAQMRAWLGSKRRTRRRAHGEGWGGARRTSATRTEQPINQPSNTKTPTIQHQNYQTTDQPTTLSLSLVRLPTSPAPNLFTCKLLFSPCLPECLNWTTGPRSFTTGSRATARRTS